MQGAMEAPGEVGMRVTTPEWLTQHNCHLLSSKDGRSWLVYLGKEPQYLLMPLPAKGKFTCRISQTINGHRFDNGTIYASADDALRGGLEELRKALGW
jgi:hypothetical protein